MKDSWCAKSIAANEDLNSSDEQQGQQESGQSAAVAPVGHAGISYTSQYTSTFGCFNILPNCIKEFRMRIENQI
ncbi:unnamed protein product [Adineta ricciae]|uniref:Uncharacterized protein n=1 Tax=Adineta ricciae TaxID=249248 RepID=A0A814W042_ADIRI|nr:unnamed protein product [Adineta ricciae]